MEKEQNSTIQVTSMSDLQAWASGKIVALPGWDDDKPFYAKLKRPSMLVLVKSGKIPNSLLKQANALFEGGVQSFDTEDENALANTVEIFEIFCEASFVEPSYAELKAANVELTDEQMVSVFAYVQSGVKALERFLPEQGGS